MKSRFVMEMDRRSERAYQRLRSEILHGDLVPGERLVAAELHDRFRLGLTPIREALMRLSSEGLVASQAHRGARVMEASLPELIDLMESRRAIERLCLAAAIERGNAIWESEIVAAMHLLSRTSLPTSVQDRDAAAAWEACHRQFHAALVSACGSQWMLRIWNMLVDHSERYREIRLLRRKDAKAQVRDIEAEHRAIMVAVLDRDAKAALTLMDAHLAATQTSVANLIETPQPQASERPKDTCSVKHIEEGIAE
jgi:DNA-binding GntR family transcriptional regulator